MTTLLDVPGALDPSCAYATDAVTMLPGRAALLDVLALRRPPLGHPASSGVVLVGLVAPALPVGAGVLLDVAAALIGALEEGEWVARCGAVEFAVVTEEALDAAARRLLTALDLPVAAGVCPVTAQREAAEVVRLAGLGLAIARQGRPGDLVRYPTC